MTREFFITKEMLQQSCRQSATRCPVGLALQAGGVEVHEVGYNFISCTFGGRRYVVPLPANAFALLRRHDAQLAVATTHFSITFVDELHRPLPERFRPKPMPKAPPLPVPPGGLAQAAAWFPTLRQLSTKMAALFM